jgi:hypothetical protein
MPLPSVSMFDAIFMLVERTDLRVAVSGAVFALARF